MLMRSSLTLSSLTMVIAACSSSTGEGIDGSNSGSQGGAFYSSQGGAFYSSQGGAFYSSQGGAFWNVGGNGGSGNGSNAGDGNNAGTGNSAASGNNGGTGASISGQSTGGDWGSSTAGDTSTSACQPLTSTGKQLPPVIMFQIDITNSMTNTTPTTGNQSKWQATQSALEAVLPQLPQDWVVGMTFFNKPAPQNGGCYDGTQFTLVAPAPLSQNLTAIDNAINGITLQASVATWTPTLNAWQYAFNYIVGNWPNSDQYASAHKYIVFMTDGVPTVDRDGCTSGNSCTVACVSLSEYDYFIQTIADTGVPNGIETFFIGVPGSEEAQGAPYDPRQMLSQLAYAGGTAPAGSTQASCAAATAGNYCHIDLTTSSNFSSALENAVQYTVGNSVTKSCVFNVPTPPSNQYYVDLAHTTVIYTAGDGTTQTLNAASSSDCTSGDFYTDDPTTATTLTLCPAMCAQLNADANAQVTVTFECTKIG